MPISLLPEEINEQLPTLQLLDVPLVNTISLPNFIKPSIPNPPQVVNSPPNNPYEKIMKLGELLLDINLETVTYYQEIIDKYQLGYELDKINEELSKYDNIDIDEFMVIEYRNKVKKYKDYLYQFNHLTKTLAEVKIAVKPKVSSLELSDQITNLETEIKVLNNKIYFSQIDAQLKAENITMSLILSDIKQLTECESDVNYIRQIVIETSNSALEDIVNEINVITNNILESIFNENITVLLRTTKESKTKDETKSLVNLQIHYQGAIYDDIKQVSGGEAKRISFALTVALSKVCESPVLLLDECIDNFETKIREKCLKILRQYLPDKTIIHISHFGNEGRYDKLIDLKSEEPDTYEI